jgi:hypothetical protein
MGENKSCICEAHGPRITHRAMISSNLYWWIKWSPVIDSRVASEWRKNVVLSSCVCRSQYLFQPFLCWSMRVEVKRERGGCWMIFGVPLLLEHEGWGKERTGQLLDDIWSAVVRRIAALMRRATHATFLWCPCLLQKPASLLFVVYVWTQAEVSSDYQKPFRIWFFVFQNRSCLAIYERYGR